MQLLWFYLGRQIFNVNNHAKSARVDVAADGNVYWVSGGKDHAWLSLTGINFPAGSPTSTALQLGGGWTNYGGSYTPAPN